MTDAHPAPNHEGFRKAAVILASLDTDTAARVCEKLDVETVRAIASQIARLTTLRQQERDAVVGDFLGALDDTAVIEGPKQARELLRRVLGRELDDDAFAEVEAEVEGGRAPHLADYLHNLDPATVQRYLRNEMSQTLAVVLSYLPPEQVAAALALADEQRRAELIFRMATMRPLAPGALEALSEGVYELTHSALATGSKYKAVTPQFLADIVSNLPQEASKSLMESLRQRAPETASNVDELIFTFDDALHLDDRSLQVVLRALDGRTMALALKNLGEDGRERVFGNLSSRAREMLEEEIDLLGAVRVRDVEDARRQVAMKARELAEQGEIIIGHGEELV